MQYKILFKSLILLVFLALFPQLHKSAKQTTIVNKIYF
ncbi:hypothetical protein AsAng_0014990 [Aureispira anguillae]|uniref:Uncharacterized protein n=1 Tax=Aureispira anguillae TaxID=2864201 RepID=A0A915YCX6_9BACT|nr:hypothetical protein AsAng_0014990 [Aureispira anguillae]